VRRAMGVALQNVERHVTGLSRIVILSPRIVTLLSPNSWSGLGFGVLAQGSTQ
jgi:hypothetical protein